MVILVVVVVVVPQGYRCLRVSISLGIGIVSITIEVGLLNTGMVRGLVLW